MPLDGFDCSGIAEDPQRKDESFVYSSHDADDERRAAEHLEAELDALSEGEFVELFGGPPAPPTAKPTPVDIVERSRQLRAKIDADKRAQRDHARAVMGERRTERRIAKSPHYQPGMTPEEFREAGPRLRQKAYRERLRPRATPAVAVPTVPPLPGNKAVAEAKALIAEWLLTDTPQVRQVRARVAKDRAYRLHLILALCAMREDLGLSQSELSARMTAWAKLMAERSPKGERLVHEVWTRRRAQNLIKTCEAIIGEVGS